MDNETERNNELTTPPDNPTTLKDWLWRVKQYERDIFVREQIGGKWCCVAISELSPERWAYWVATWLEEDRVPTRILRFKEE